ncbi:Maf family protein [Alkalihalobacillus pseudalcaliphilus]|uniref:Maf family protein n=1 Tax=Alkalihalobacillus pseudalcaliphilus TaxID=79884 RepID=UPI00064DCB40|nr:Maf family protein [Alkalihalobacillus pseudalcaliphilus]KMK74664.1 septum formation protein Maf [Alkalihalobacillus pseudalcaliphilus]
MIPFILASSSPRRQDLLQQVDFSFEVISKDTTEEVTENLQPSELVIHLAERKAKAVFAEHQHRVVLGADTIVALDNTILGKPKSRADAFKMLRMLSGQSHFVYTGVAILSAERTAIFYEKTEVQMYALSEADIETYLESGESIGKAGAYAIQGYGAYLVKGIHGDYQNVVGLPVAAVTRSLESFAIYPQWKKINHWKE